MRNPYEPGHEKTCLMSYANNKGAVAMQWLVSVITTFITDRKTTKRACYSSYMILCAYTEPPGFKEEPKGRICHKHFENNEICRTSERPYQKET